MANENINYKVGADTKQAEKNAENLEKKFDKVGDSVERTNDELERQQREEVNLVRFSLE
jgi:phage-related minor tail protein